MVHYKLTYFNSRGLGETARQLFALAEVEYEDVRLEHGDGSWEKLKPTTPLGHLPVLSVDGFEIAQSAAINRYLAKKFGFAGKTLEEEAWADAIVDQLKDYSNDFRKLVHAKKEGKSEEEIERIKKEVCLPARDSYFKDLKKLLAKNKSGFLISDDVTWADLVIAENLTNLKSHGFFIPSEEPKLDAFHKKVCSIPQLNSWLEKRPATNF